MRRRAASWVVAAVRRRRLGWARTSEAPELAVMAPGRAHCGLAEGYPMCLLSAHGDKAGSAAAGDTMGGCGGAAAGAAAAGIGS